MKRLLRISFFIVIFQDAWSIDTVDKTFQWQASPQSGLYAPLNQSIPSYQYTTDSGKIDLSQSHIGETFLIAVRDPDCPISRRYASKLQKFESKGLTIIYLLTGDLANRKSVIKDQQRHGLNGAYILDKNRRLSEWLGVLTSAEVYLFDRSAKLRYRGAIDDQYGIGFSKSKPEQEFLRDALTAINSDMPVKLATTSAPGCIIREVKRHSNTLKNITWHKDIDTLIKNKCQLCHRPGQAGPFPLQTYEQVFEKKEMIRFVLEKNIMPPWSVTDNSDRLVNSDKYLSDTNRQKIIDWIDKGAPQGNPHNNLSKKYIWDTDWKYGVPDIILTSPEIINIPAEGEVKYKYVSIPTNFNEDRWVHTTEVATDTPENTHHIILFILPPERYFDKHMPGTQNSTVLNRKELHEMALRGFFSGYIPGLPGVTYQNGFAKLLPKGWRIVLQIHHQTTGIETNDQPRIGLQFLNKPPNKIINTLAATNIKLNIPAGAENHLETAKYTFKNNGEIVGLYPHMHLRGKAFRYELIKNNGSKELLLDVPRYDPNWQQYYQFKEPILISKGETLIASGWYDNSKENLNNPNPSVNVKFGLRTRDEMLIGYFDWVNTKNK